MSTLDRIEVKAQFTAGDAGAITGRAWVWDQPDRVNDMIEPAAFKSAAPPIPMLAYHDPKKPVGAWDSLTVKQDGLLVAGKLLIDDSPLAREVYAFVRAGAVKGLSIGFETKRATTRKGGGRTIQALDLAEISLVTIPMHPGARVSGVKSAAAAIALADAINRAAAALRAR
jgi:HK97 family phage prohead protease